MDGGSTIGVPNTAVALPDIPHGSRTEAQAASKGRGGVTARGRSGIILEGALVDRARVCTGDALGAGTGLEGRALSGRGGQADGGQRKTASLGIDGRSRDGAWVGLCLGGSAALAKDVSEGLASDGGAPTVGGTGARQGRRVAIGGHLGGGCEQCSRVGVDADGRSIGVCEQVVTVSVWMREA